MAKTYNIGGKTYNESGSEIDADGWTLGASTPYRNKNSSSIDTTKLRADVLASGQTWGDAPQSAQTTPNLPQVTPNVPQTTPNVPQITPNQPLTPANQAPTPSPYGNIPADFAPQGSVPYSQAMSSVPKGANQGTIQGNLAKAYGQAHQQLQQGGGPNPMGGTRGIVQNAVQRNTQTEGYISPPEIQTEMDKLMSTYTQAVSQFLNPETQRTSLVDEYKALSSNLGISELKAELMDVNRIMNGNEDDIRSEITAAGGWATDGQVQAMTLGRNKSLLKKAQYISDQLSGAREELGTMIQLTSQDRQFAEQRMATGFSLMGNLIQVKQTMDKSAQDNFWNVQKAIGFDGIMAGTKGDPFLIRQVEKSIGGGFNLQTAAQQATEARVLEQRKADLQNQVLESNLLTDQVQRNSLRGMYDKSTGDGAPKVTSINGVDSIWNAKTGKFEPVPTSGGGTQSAGQLAHAQGNIESITSILNDKAIRSSVGPSGLSRFIGRGLDSATGARQNFIAGVQQLTSQLTLDTLSKAKGSGASFGALSDSELQLLASAGSKLDKWAKKDKNGNVTGYNTSEKLFKQEVDKINNYQKLDYLLKGGTPADVGVQVMPDGTYWSKNSNGTLTQLQ